MVVPNEAWWLCSGAEQGLEKAPAIPRCPWFSGRTGEGIDETHPRLLKE